MQPDQTVFSAILPEDLDWKPFPAFPPSVRLAVVVGRPSEPGPYVIRVKVPSGIRLMPHRHPEDRVYTVMSGIFYIGLGDRFEGDKIRPYPPGSVIVLPGNTPHFHWAKSGEYVTQVAAVGPLGLEYVNLRDDPREAASNQEPAETESAGHHRADQPDDPLAFETLIVRKEGAVLFAAIAAPPMNLLGPALVRDLVSIIQYAEADDAVRVLVFTSGDPDYFISHVDVTQIQEYRQEAAKLAGEASIGLLFRRLSNSRLVTVAQIEGRVRGAGSEFVLACDMRFAARETAIFAQPEPGLGLSPGAGGIQHLTRLMGRARALEVMLSADDYDAELAERYGWINRALPAGQLGGFVSSLAHRIARFPSTGQAIVKDRVNAIALAPVEDFRRDSDLFGEGSRTPASQRRTQAAMKRGFQTHDGEMALGRLLDELLDP